MLQNINVVIYPLTMRSSNGNISRVTGPLVRGIQWRPVNSPHKGQWHEALMFSLICTWMNCWVNNHEAGELRCHCAHYDVTVMQYANPGAWNTQKKNVWKSSWQGFPNMASDWLASETRSKNSCMITWILTWKFISNPRELIWIQGKISWGLWCLKQVSEVWTSNHIHEY